MTTYKRYVDHLSGNKLPRWISLIFDLVILEDPQEWCSSELPGSKVEQSSGLKLGEHKKGVFLHLINLLACLGGRRMDLSSDPTFLLLGWLMNSAICCSAICKFPTCVVNLIKVWTELEMDNITLRTGACCTWPHQPQQGCLSKLPTIWCGEGAAFRSFSGNSRLPTRQECALSLPVYFLAG